MIAFYKLNTNDQDKIRLMERQLAELERQLDQPDLHPYRNQILQEIELLEADYYGFLSYLETVYGDNK